MLPRLTHRVADNNAFHSQPVTYTRTTRRTEIFQIGAASKHAHFAENSLQFGDKTKQMARCGLAADQLARLIVQRYGHL